MRCAFCREFWLSSDFAWRRSGAAVSRLRAVCSTVASAFGGLLVASHIPYGGLRTYRKYLLFLAINEKVREPNGGRV